jgi:hypothetical protein
MSSTDQTAGELQEVTATLIKEEMPLRTPMRVAFSKEAGSQIINSAVVGYRGTVFFVAAPIGLRPVLETLAHLQFATPRGLYTFVSRLVEVADTERTASRKMLGFILPPAWTRIQRRAHFRVSLQVPVSASPEGNAKRAVSGQCVNISAAGILVILPHPFKVGQSFKLSFDLLREGASPLSFDLGAKIIRIQSTIRKGETTKIFMHGFQFDEMSTRDQDRLAQYLWKISKGRSIA